MGKLLQFTILLMVASCSYKNPFLFTSDYRQFPVAVDCEKATDVSLTFQKDGMPTVHIDDHSVEFKNLVDDKGKMRPICIFENMTLLQFCQYKGADAVGPYWVPAYQKIDAAKCKEVLRNQ